MLNLNFLFTFVLDLVEDMTEDQLKLLNDFEARVRQMIFKCDELKRENAQLRSNLDEEKQLVETLSEENKTWKEKYDNLKVARIITVRQGDFASAKKRLSSLVREVDKCIALLKE